MFSFAGTQFSEDTAQRHREYSRTTLNTMPWYIKLGQESQERLANLGRCLLNCVYDALEGGNIIQANFSTGEVKNLTSGKVLQADPLPEVAIKILNDGGVVGLLREEYAKK